MANKKAFFKYFNSQGEQITSKSARLIINQSSEIIEHRNHVSKLTMKRAKKQARKHFNDPRYKDQPFFKEGVEFRLANPTAA